MCVAAAQAETLDEMLEKILAWATPTLTCKHSHLYYCYTSLTPTRDLFCRLRPILTAFLKPENAVSGLM